MKRAYLLAASFACVGGVSCGTGVHDGDQPQSVTKSIAKSGGTVKFMGGELDICDNCLADDATIKLTWHRAIDYTGAISSVYDLEVPGPSTFRNDPKITIWTTDDVASKDHNVIGSMVPSVGVWVPNTSKWPEACRPSSVCGPVQSQIFQSTNVLRLAIVTECYAGLDTQCPSGQSCRVANACQQCPAGSHCP